MQDKETMKNEVYTPMQQVKDRFYNAKTQEEWNEIKEDYKAIVAKAKELMDCSFFDKWNEGNQQTITKIYSYKEKLFNKKTFVAQPKQSYIFRENEGEAFVRLCNALADFLEKKR